VFSMSMTRSTAMRYERDGVTPTLATPSAARKRVCRTRAPGRFHPRQEAAASEGGT
jgi:hypothetical protein